MIYFFYGVDREGTRARARAVLDIMKKKRPEAEYFRITADNWNQAEFEGFISGQGLFDQKFIIFVDGLFENKQGRDWIISRTKELGGSENAFVFLENGIDAVSLKKIKVAARETKEFTKNSGRNGSGSSQVFNSGDFKIFAISDALGRRDRKELWALFTEAALKGISPEEISGILFWQVKSMVLAGETSDASKAGLSSFVFGKSKRYASNFKREELIKMSGDLVDLYHDSRRGFFDLITALERFVLKV